MRRCDVIIPIYNAYDCLKNCIDSVLKNTDFRWTHLILIDDRSTDERIIPLLEQYARKNPKKITFLKNKRNLGFVGTVNRGIRYSKNDVLLLNSDTEVPGRWLERIRDCAYMGKMIATVTPLSNNATLASVPENFVRNELPRGYDLRKMDKLIEQESLKLYPEIPTAHGFCMYIKRAVLDDVGLFDQKTFGKGYGEENDFCFRCMRRGYRNVLCDNVYILHKESQSFLDTKEDHQSLLKNKHPNFTLTLHKWCIDGGVKIIGENIKIALEVQKRRPNILILIHDFSSSVGGTTLHVMDLIDRLRDKYNFHVLFFEDGIYKVRSFFEKYDVLTGVYKKSMYLTRAKEDTDLTPDELFSNEYAKMLDEIFIRYKISFVHIHHMLGHYFDVIDVCKNKNIKYAVSLHDVYLYFPIANRFAEEVDKNKESPIDIKKWREVCGELLQNADRIIAPAEIVRKKYLCFYSGLEIDVIRHGIDLKKNKPSHTLSDGCKNIAFVGGVGLQKGSELLERIIPELERRGGVKIHLFGVTTARVHDNDVFEDHGVYKREDLPRLLNDAKIDLVCNFSLIFETYAYVVDEVAASGVPSLAFDFGASGERIKKEKLGWVMHYTDDVTEIADTIEDILEDKRGEYLDRMMAINKYQIKSVESMANDYDKIYSQKVRPAILESGVIKEGVLFGDMMENAIKTVKKYDQAVYNVQLNNYVFAMKGVQENYEQISNSLRWKIASRIKVPGWISRSIGRKRKYGTKKSVI